MNILEYPVIYYEDNLVFILKEGKVECLACYNWAGHGFDFLGDDEKLQHLHKKGTGFQHVYSEVHIKMMPTQFNMSDNINYLKSMTTGDLKPIAFGYYDDLHDVMVEDGHSESNEYERHLIITLKKPRVLKDTIQAILKDPVTAINQYFNLEIPDLYQREIEAYKQLEERLRRRLKQSFNIRKLSEIEIEKDIREPYYRGLKPPKLRSKDNYYDIRKRGYVSGKGWKPSVEEIEVDGIKAYRPLKRDIFTMNDAIIRRHKRHIEIEHERDGKTENTYQKQIVISNFPDIEFPTGREYLYNLTTLPFPVWVSVRYEKVDYQKVLKQINQRSLELDDQMEHDRKAKVETEKDQQEQFEDIKVAKSEIKARKEDMLYTSIVLTVASSSLEECNNRAKRVQDYFDEYDIETVIPSGKIQQGLFLETMLGGKRYTQDYIRRITSEFLAGSMISATSRLGDPKGLYIGYVVSTGMPVLWDPYRAPQINRSPAISIVGTLGSGKSFLSNLLVLLSVKLGAKVLLTDPKDDRYWGDVLDYLKPHMNKIYLSANKSERGKLDIFQVILELYKDEIKDNKQRREEILKTASQFAVSITTALLGYKGAEIRSEKLTNLITKIVQTSKNPCMYDIIRYAEEMAVSKDGNAVDEQYKLIADSLKNRIETTKYGHLLFGDGTNEVVDLTKSINIIVTKGLVIPDKSIPKEEYDATQMVGVALLLCIASIGREFSFKSKTLLTPYVQDEVKVFNQNNQSKVFLEELVRVGRSENAPIYLISQNTSDIGSKETRANIGTKFVFRTNSRDEAIASLEDLGLDSESKELQDLILNLQTGYCLMKDSENRVNVIRVDPVFNDFIEAFDSKPKIVVEEDEKTKVDE